jgi:AraC-like DNA-binding protein
MARTASSRDLYRETRRKVRKLLTNDLALQLPDVCQVLKLRRHVIEAAFRETGSTFRQERSDVRMLYAKRALATSRPLKAVAADLGYGSPRSFSRFVANKIGKRPSDLQQE